MGENVDRRAHVAVVDVVAESLRTQQQVHGTPEPLVEERREGLPDRDRAPLVPGDDGPEERCGAVVPAVRRFEEGEVETRRAEGGAGRDVLGATQGHVVDVVGQTLVGLAGQRETRRVRHAAGEDGEHRDLGPRGHQPGQQRPGGEHRVVQVRGDGEDPRGVHPGAVHRRWGVTRNRQSESAVVGSTPRPLLVGRSAGGTCVHAVSGGVATTRW